MLSILLALVLTAGPPANAPDKAHVGKSGATVFLVSAKPLGAREPTVPVITTPTLNVNGQPVPMTTGPVSGGFWAFSLAKPVNQADDLRITASAGWAQSMPALDLPVRNSTGRLEFAVPEKPSMGLGLNISGMPLVAGAQWSPVGNWAKRLWPWYGDSVETNARGDVVRMKGVIASAPFYFGNTANGIDNKGLPGLGSNLWTVAWDSPDPQTDFGLSERWGPPSGWTIKDRPELSSPGKDGIGITRVFEATPLPTSAFRAPILQLDVKHPKGTPNYSGLWIAPPGNTADRSDPLAMESWTARCLSLGGGKGPSVLRWIDSCAPYGAQGNTAAVEHLPDVDKTSWCLNQRTLTVPIARLRPITPKTNPTITTPHGPLPVAARLVSSLGAEAVCEAPHGLYSGQVGWVLLPNVTLSAGGKSVTPKAIWTTIWVTSPTAFGVGSWPDLDAAVETPGSSVQVVIPGSLIPYEFAAATVSRWDNTILWIPIPHLSTNDAVDEIARRVLKNLAPGHWVTPEFTDETWNYGFQQANYCSMMGQFVGIADGYWPDRYSAKRQAEIAARFAAVFSREGRAGDVKLLLATQFGWMTRGLLDWAASQGIKADIVSGAPYWDMLPEWGQFTVNWTDAQIQDLYRAFLVHDSWCRKFWDDWNLALSTYETAIGRRVLRYTYEGGTESAVSGMPGVNLVARSLDALGHPDAADTERVLYSQAQANGVDVFTYYTMLAPPDSGGTNWGLWNYQGQPTGSGLSNPRIGASGEWRPMESVRGHAWREWQRGHLLSR